MRADNDAHGWLIGVPLSAARAAKLATGYTALHALAELFDAERVQQLLGHTPAEVVAEAIGAAVWELSIDCLPLSRSGVPLTRRAQ